MGWNSEAPRSPRGSLPPAMLIGQRYVLRELLGRGGMGDVYRVTDTANEQDVALKLLRTPRLRRSSLSPGARRGAERPSIRRAELVAARRAQRHALFEREYHTLAQLAHPRIIEAYDYGFEGGVPYYTMELLTGHDISKLAPAPWPRVCAMMRDVASALTLLHSRRLLHRDLSPNNVHQQADGFCKLIDFGTMGAVGKPDEIVGTPPFMPPELLRREPLDTRSDLYSLGALAYYQLTGRTVHPVRSLADLHSFLEVRPSAPSCHAAGVPRGLDALLLQLLSPDPALRPSSTIEVLDRLSAIDGSEPGAGRRSLPVAVSRPGLVGRGDELKSVQDRIGLALRGEGTNLLIAGVAGSGRSRFLDACALAGRLAGARVLRGAPDAALEAPYATLSLLLHQLVASLGGAERTELAPPEEVARALLSRAAAPAAEPDEAGAIDWAAVRAKLSSYLVQVSLRRGLMIAIDDFERVDGPSASLIAALAQRAEAEHLLLLVSVDADTLTAPSEAVRAYRAHATDVTLAALSLPHTQSLLASVFGDVPNLGPLAARVHGLSGGNPRLTMELAQHLVDAGVIRCQLGGYLLPDLISSQDLPTNLGDALRARVQRLSAAAQTLASTLAISGGAALSVEESFAISELSLADAGPAALAELGDAGVAEPRGNRVALRQPAMAEALRSSLSPAAQRALHARIAAQLADDSTRRVQAADHYFRAALDSQAVDVLLAAIASSYAGRTWYAGHSALIECGLAACARLDRPKRDAFALQNALVLQALAYNEPCERETLLAFGRLLHQLSGLRDWEETDPELAPGERVAEALRRAEARYQATPEHERILAPMAALRQLMTYLTRIGGFASTALDLDLLKSLPSVAPFAALGPTIALVERLIVGLRNLRTGLVEHYLEFGSWVCERLAQPDGAGLPLSDARSFAINIKYGLGLIEASLGRPAAFAYADEIESSTNHRVNAWRIRQMAHLFLADAGAADACRREVEALQIEDGSRQFLEGSPLELESIAYAETDDLLGLRRILPALEAMAEKHEGWRTKLLVARGDLQRVRGQPQVALELYEAALARVPAAKHALWTYAAGGQLRALLELGRADEARALGLRYVRCARDAGLQLTLHAVELALADSEAALGMFEAARARVEELTARALAASVRGVQLGIIYEAGARHAVLARDRAAFAHYHKAAAETLGHARHPAFSARLEQLADQARSASITPGEDADAGSSPLQLRDMLGQLTSCPSEERAAEALKLLMNATGAAAGHLYMAHEGRLELVASSATRPPPADLGAFLSNYMESAAVTDDRTLDIAFPTSLVERDCVTEPLLLCATRESGRTIVGVVALSFAGARHWPDPSLIETIAERLADD
jgi:Protein kinase domain/AAA ATPase domain